jgi:hypothetical protein
VGEEVKERLNYQSGGRKGKGVTDLAVIIETMSHAHLILTIVTHPKLNKDTFCN